MSGEQDSLRYRFDDFTEAAYRGLLRSSRKRFSFERFGSRSEAPHVLWRHDVDLSMHRACRLACIEAEEGVLATYFVLLRSEFYNLLEKPVLEKLGQIVALGHDIGLHFDAGYYGPGAQALETGLAWEKKLLEDLLHRPVAAFSFHDPAPDIFDKFPMDVLAGMTNVYGASVRSRYHYCSDSNGYWRHERLHDLLEAGSEPRLHVLTHPEWWVPEPMSPRERVRRCIEGRSACVYSKYVESLSLSGRENIGD